MFERHRLEKEEGKAYNEPGVSELFAYVHRILNIHDLVLQGIQRDEGAEQEVWHAPWLEFIG